jgi:hypothetical protein
MGFNFPASPVLGSTYTSGGVTYTWNGYGWVGGGIGDAPLDGKTYGRKDALWSEAATKAYADTQDALNVAKAGSTMSGFLTLHADPDAAMKASTKQYVDNKVAAVPVPDISGKVSKSGDTMSGPLTVNGAFTTNSTIQLNQQAASVYQGGPGGIIIYANGSAGYDAFISYWRPGGGYATNMGLMNDNRFGFGGWSVGSGVQYRFWSREDFGEPPVHNTRLVYAGDYAHSSDEGLNEVYGPTGCQTGSSGAVLSGYGGSWLTVRYRYLQVRRSDGYYGSEAA